MTAAIQAADAGKNVLLVEKMPYAGGNTTRATAGLNAAETHYQKEQEIVDSVEQYVKDTMEGGHNLNDPALVQVLAERSASAIDWLDSIGAELKKIAFTGGCTNARTHAPEDGSGVGTYLVTAFKNQLQEKNIPVLYDTTVTGIIMKDGHAVLVAGSLTDDPAISAELRNKLLKTVGEYNKDLQRSQQIYDVIVRKDPLPRTVTGKLKRYELQDEINE
jgi:fumarate reductase flavoprotein subunit